MGARPGLMHFFGFKQLLDDRNRETSCIFADDQGI